MLHPVGGRRQPTAGVQDILEVDQQLAKQWWRLSNARENTLATPTLRIRRNRRKHSHGPGIHQLAAGGVHYQVEMAEKIYPQDGKTHIR
jgi:hypothetical protein